jgi:hypothetical protein
MVSVLLEKFHQKLEPSDRIAGNDRRKHQQHTMLSEDAKGQLKDLGQ